MKKIFSQSFHLLDEGDALINYIGDPNKIELPIYKIKEGRKFNFIAEEKDDVVYIKYSNKHKNDKYSFEYLKEHGKSEITPMEENKLALLAFKHFLCFHVIKYFKKAKKFQFGNKIFKRKDITDITSEIKYNFGYQNLMIASSKKSHNKTYEWLNSFSITELISGRFTLDILCKMVDKILSKKEQREFKQQLINALITMRKI